MIPNKRRREVAVVGIGGDCAAGKCLFEIKNSLLGDVVRCVQVPKKLYSGEGDFPVFISDSIQFSRKCRNLLERGCFEFRHNQPNRTLLLLLNAFAEALDNAELDISALRSCKVGIVLGTTAGCTFNDEQYYLDWKNGRKVESVDFLKYLEANIAGFLQQVLGVTGPVTVVTNACASGTDAVGIARRWILRGYCDIAIAGGADALSRNAIYGFAALMLLSGSPCRPFDKNRDGLNLGEGAAVLILEKNEMAAKRGIIPWGWVCGYGTASDSYHPVAPHPEGRGLRHALRVALADAGVVPEKVCFVNAHGTGTSANDSAEMNALAGSGLTNCPVVSTKGITGHMLGAAGAMEAILTILTLGGRQSRGTVGCITADSKLARLPLQQSEVVRLHNQIGITQSLAFGGTNSVLVLEATIKRNETLDNYC